MAREKAVATTKRGQTSGGKTAPGKKQAAKRKGAMVLAAAAVDRGAAALARKGRQLPKRKWMNSIKKNGERRRRKKRKQWKRICVRKRAKRKRGKELGISKSKRIRASGTKDVQDQRYSMLPSCCFLTC